MEKTSLKSETKYCYCEISPNKDILQENINHSFCQKCGSILIKNSQGIINYTLQNKYKQENCEINPITFIKIMKKRTEDALPYIYNIYNSDIVDKSKNEKSINIYLKHRKKLISKLQKLKKIFNYIDNVFYETLFYLDTYLSHDIDEEISQKKLLYYLVGYFLCVAKFHEIEILKPNFDNFFEIEKGIYLSQEKIGYYEQLCLKRINYNLFSYSAHDWLIILCSNGVIFNNEIENNNEIILINGHRHSIVNAIRKYSKKLLLAITIKPIFFKYAPMYIALSLIQISREKYIKNNIIKPKLFFKLIYLYGINFIDYQQCYEEIKTETKEENRNDLDKENTKINKENPTEGNNINNMKRVSLNQYNEESKIFGMNISIINFYRKRKKTNTNITLKKNLPTEIKEVNKNKVFNDNNYQNPKLSRNKHISIDYSNNYFNRNSINFLPIINTDRERTEKIPIPITSNKPNVFLSFDQNQNNENSFSRGDNLNNIRLANMRHLTYKKDIPINLKEINSNKAYKLSLIEHNFILDNPKRKMKIEKNLNIKLNKEYC